MMDEEGFPVPGFPGLAEDQSSEGFLLPQFPGLDRTISYPRIPCKESGEAALYPVLVLRRLPERIRRRDSEGGTRRRFRIDEGRRSGQTTMEKEESRRMLEMEFPAIFMSPELYPMGEERMNRVLHIPISQGCLCNDSACPMSLTAGKPIQACPTRAQKETKNQIRVTGFNELIYGAKIFDRRKDEEKKVLQKFLMLRFVPFILFFYSVMLHLWQCVPHLHFLGVFRQVYMHMRIHQVGDEKGIEPVFTGSVYKGPVIYFIRVVKCPYCRHKAEAKLFQRYLESTVKERRAAAVVEHGEKITGTSRSRPLL